MPKNFKSEENNLTFQSLIKNFLHPNPNIYLEASKRMTTHFPCESELYLFKQLYSEDVQLRRKSVKAISLFQEKVIPQIIELYNKESKINVRMCCLKIFIKLAHLIENSAYQEKVHEIINTALVGESLEMQLVAVMLLKQIGSSSIPSLMQISRGNNILSARAAITALNEFNDPFVINFLNNLSKEEDIDYLVKDAI